MNLIGSGGGPDGPSGFLRVGGMLVLVDKKFAGLGSDRFFEAIVAEDFLEMGHGVERGFRFEVAGESGAGVERGLVAVVEEIDVGPLDGHGGEEKEGADDPLGLLGIGDSFPFGESSGFLVGFGGTVVSKFGDPNWSVLYVLVPPGDEVFDVFQVAGQGGVFGKAALPGRPAGELGINVDGEDIDKVVEPLQAGHTLLVVAAFSGGEVAGADYELRIAGPQSGGHGAENSGVVGVGPLSGFVSDFDRLDELAVSRGAELAGKILAVSSRILLKIIPLVDGN